MVNEMVLILLSLFSVSNAASTFAALSRTENDVTWLLLCSVAADGMIVNGIAVTRGVTPADPLVNRSLT